MPNLGHRARKILHALITEHIETGSPVGSRTLARNYSFGLSPASIRNVLADLEDDGYLQQPHTSAGRVPTEHGLRVFVESLLNNIQISEHDKDQVVRRLYALRHGDDVMTTTGQLLARMTGGAAVITKPGVDREQLSELRFVSVRPGEVLAVVVTRNGSVDHRLFALADHLSAQELERVHNYISARITGRSLEQLRSLISEELRTEHHQYRALQQRVMDLLNAASEGQQHSQQIVIEGRSQLLDQPEFNDVETLKAMLRAFEDKTLLLTLLDGALSVDGVRVLIGSQVKLPDAPALSLISAGYKQDGRSAGTIGVLGPARIDYAKVVPLVNFTASVMTDLFDRTDD